MGCCSSSACRSAFKKKKKSKGRNGKEDLKEINSLQDGGGKVPLEELGPSLDKLHEQFEWRLRTLQDAVRAAGAKERENLLQAHHLQLSRLLQDVTEKVKADTTADLNTLFEEKLTANAEEHQSRAEELQKVHDQEKISLREESEACLASLRGKVDGLTAELKLFDELKQRVHDSSLKRDLQRNVQVRRSLPGKPRHDRSRSLDVCAGKPRVFWEQELESLLFVIEMKSKQLQEQGRKLLQAEVLMERNITLEDQVKHVQQQNEDLGARINNYQALIQDLSREHDSLQEALRKETLFIQKLSQEKEELLYKLLQRDSGLALHHSPVTPQLTPS
ncbi:hypothetical protein AAFF_G00053730 [Aldrovandia affinis]|uniref:Coiled-coil domain-containing protein 69 n=1 Tax=Aldrovandia affinis TaxID=143900 RepID=A0AAD7S102_9TELE|nr:hypothetical protein AAFF_G00053730 [Aldrovandia affinis]